MSHPVCFCLDCRTALHGDDVCDASDDHRVVKLDQSGAHEELVAVAWGAASVRESERAMAQRSDQALVLLTLFILLTGLVGVWLITSALTLPHIIGVMVAAMGVLFGGAFVLRRNRSFPLGAQPLLPSGSARGCGEVAGRARVCSPATATLCIAYGIELHLEGDGADRIMYRDGFTCGFEVDLDDGSLARVPPGRIRIVGELRQAMDLDNPELEAYLAEVDSRRAPDSPYDPFRYNVVYEAIILPGDRVELLSAFEPRLAANAPAPLYRKSMPSVLWPNNVPRIRQITSTV